MNSKIKDRIVDLGEIEKREGRIGRRLDQSFIGDDNNFVGSLMRGIEIIVDIGIIEENEISGR